MLTDNDIQKIKEAFKADFTGIRTDVKGIRTDIANHDQRFDELAESINKIHEDVSIKKDVERVKVVLREKLHAEI